MMDVEHGRHSIEPEPIEGVLVHPPGEVTQEKPQDLPFPVVE
jgi:hypothetical protein